jgi:hypothetical protein
MMRRLLLLGIEDLEEKCQGRGRRSDKVIRRS